MASSKEAGASAEGSCPAGVDASGRNSCWLVCKRCGSRIVEPGVGTYVEREIFLPAMEKKEGIAGVTEGESLRHFVVLTNMLQFENVGFTLPVRNLKYLVCADCEVGPVGVHDINFPKEFLVAFDRVQVDESGSASRPRMQLTGDQLSTH